MSEKKIKNINTLCSELHEDFYAAICANSKIGEPFTAEYIDGFHAGYRALQTRFIVAMEKDELNYTHKAKSP